MRATRSPWIKTFTGLSTRCANGSYSIQRRQAGREQNIDARVGKLLQTSDDAVEVG